MFLYYVSPYWTQDLNRIGLGFTLVDLGHLNNILCYFIKLIEDIISSVSRSACRDFTLKVQNRNLKSTYVTF